MASGNGHCNNHGQEMMIAKYIALYDHYQAMSLPECTNVAELRNHYQTAANTIMLRMMRIVRGQMEQTNGK